ncbi:MAG: N-acetyl-gamma-glutamyl-phosphate reductase [Magnetococcales bacterium]|nr:N-acetyl-gamma-glutamyl-phosphate reductase [Magnetococcales bacterium]MBF0322844.1 N-acetyl-gamma-glutamyl-phosphate reductase [Magnetococcales bacterium]
MAKISVGILGATGYTGGELVRILSRHPAVQITWVTSERYADKPLTDAFPHLRGAGDLRCQKLVPSRAAVECEVAFCAMPHLTSMEVVPQLLGQGCRVVDLSADFRLHDPRIFQEWYGVEHKAADLLYEAVYGLPERHRATLGKARLVANPGCYPTSVLLALGPLLEAEAVEPGTIIIDSKSGVSGAGRSAQQGSLFAELQDGFRPYKVTGHRHIAEMEQELTGYAGRPVQIRFTPHLLPQSRGILSTLYLRPQQGRTAATVRELLAWRYEQEPFVRVLPEGELPATSEVRGSNYCHLGVTMDKRTGWLMVFSVIDNLVKGAAGQAIQNFNLMMGRPETEGLDQVALFP